MTLKELLAVFIVYGHNFKVLHWQASGHKFDRIHALANEYYEKIAEDTDTIAEMAARLGINSLGYIEAADVLKNLEKDFVVVESNRLYGFIHFTDTADAMLRGILASIEEVHESEVMKDPKNMGIKSELESIYNWYDLQYRYLNLRRTEEIED